MEIWYADTNDFSDCQAIESVLSEDEMFQGGRFVFPQQREHYYRTKYITRTVASRYLNEQPALVKFLKTAEGKPAFEGNSQLHFNVSDSGTMFVIAFSDAPVGIDIERVRALDNIDCVASDICSGDEYIYFSTLASEDKLRFFFKLWSVKESYLKLTGSGLLKEPKSITLQDHSVLLHKDIVSINDGMTAYSVRLNLNIENLEGFVCSRKNDLELVIRKATPDVII